MLGEQILIELWRNILSPL